MFDCEQNECRSALRSPARGRAPAVAPRRPSLRGCGSLAMIPASGVGRSVGPRERTGMDLVNGERDSVAEAPRTVSTATLQHGVQYGFLAHPRIPLPGPLPGAFVPARALSGFALNFSIRGRHVRSQFAQHRTTRCLGRPCGVLRRRQPDRLCQLLLHGWVAAGDVPAELQPGLLGDRLLTHRHRAERDHHPAVQQSGRSGNRGAVVDPVPHCFRRPAGG